MRAGYKISYTKVTILLLAIILIISGAVWGVMKIFEGDSVFEGEKKKYEVLVSVRDETNPNPEEDKRSSMKKGYVIGVYDEGQKWSDTEKISYLILKMDLTQEQKEKLTRSIEKEVKREKTSEDREEGEEDRIETEVIGIREYKIDLEEIGFSDPNSLLKGQPFADKVFDWSVVEKI